MPRPRPTFYATPRGARYHRDEMCTGLTSHHIAEGSAFSIESRTPRVTPAEIRRLNLRPCLTCKPPPMLSIVPTPEETSADAT